MLFRSHFKPSNAVAFTMPYRYATGYFSTSTGCGNPVNQANCSQIITLSGVPTKAAFVLPYFLWRSASGNGGFGCSGTNSSNCNPTANAIMLSMILLWIGLFINSIILTKMDN